MQTPHIQTPYLIKTYQFRDDSYRLNYNPTDGENLKTQIDYAGDLNSLTSNDDNRKS